MSYVYELDDDLDGDLNDKAGCCEASRGLFELASGSALKAALHRFC